MAENPGTVCKRLHLNEPGEQSREEISRLNDEKFPKSDYLLECEKMPEPTRKYSNKLHAKITI